ncbi:MAG: hypothetical protein JXA97_05275 [Anaerolineales bacterium]|nr:hypothetical protein [Anaerolineales bacterium]
MIAAKKWKLVIIATAVLFSTSLYVWKSASLLHSGFPLDDAWIHQAYARNLAATGQWAFSPGNASAGSTAPLWTFLLVPAYLTGIEPTFWVGLLAIVQLGTMAWIGMRWSSKHGSGRAIGAGLLLAAEWHLVWAGLSGMETLLMGLAALLLLYLLDEEHVRPFWLGSIIGISIWIRPDAVTLLIPVGWVFLVRKRGDWKEIFRDVWMAGGGLTLFFLPYLAFNYSLSGEWWPTTFYAKQAEYAVLRDLPLYRRLVEQFMLPLVGVGALLLPGLILTTWRKIKERAWRRLAGLIWVLTYLSLYAIRLPVVYQHGRYAIPGIPIFLLIGWEGVCSWAQPGAKQWLPRVLSRVWLLSLAVGEVLFLVTGARAYARDVAIIESEMVATAVWLQEHVPKDAVLAVHDIGAIGYFSDRELLDLAGLISPDVIPYIRDENQLAEYLNAEGADYLVTFPDWYPTLTRGREIIFSTGAPFSPAEGGENMAVFEWP